MARSIRSSQLETRTARLKLPQQKKSYTASIGPGLRLAYRRRATAGRWSAICADGKGGSWLQGFADADDFEDANSKTVLSYWQAVDHARLLARGEDDKVADGGDRPTTVKQALDIYHADLKARGGDVSSVARVRLHLPSKLSNKSIALLTADDLKQWRNGLRQKLAIGSIDRIATSLRAALNMAADSDKRISRHAWEVGLKAAHDDDDAGVRNVIVSDAAIGRIVGETYGISDEFGLFVEVHAETGARPSQVARLAVEDLQDNRPDPRLMMPASRKGKKRKKKTTHLPVAISESLALRLRQASSGRTR
jgi:hypothetical protein